AGFAEALTGTTIEAVRRRGKYLVFTLAMPGTEAINVYLLIQPKLVGRLHWVDPGDKRPAKTHVVLSLSDGRELRYVDMKTMGQIYLTRAPNLIQDYASLGPDALAISLPEFRERIRRFRGEIKGVLTRGDFVAGIGNAYADEILWNARIYPFRKRTQLKPPEIDA